MNLVHRHRKELDAEHAEKDTLTKTKVVNDDADSALAVFAFSPYIHTYIRMISHFTQIPSRISLVHNINTCMYMIKLIIHIPVNNFLLQRRQKTSNNKSEYHHYSFNLMASGVK